MCVCVCVCDRYVVAAVVGLYVGRVVLRGVLGLANSARAFLLAPLGISRADIKKYGKWAGELDFSCSVEILLNWSSSCDGSF